MLTDIVHDIGYNWHKYFTAAFIIALLLTVVLGLGFKEPPHWAAWHSIEAHYEPARNAVIISSRSWTLLRSCPKGAQIGRDAIIVGRDRAVYSFKTEVNRRNFEEVGNHSSGQPIVIALVDEGGKPLGIVPERLRLVVGCGTRPLVPSPWIELKAVESGPP